MLPLSMFWLRKNKIDQQQEADEIHLAATHPGNIRLMFASVYIHISDYIPSEGPRALQ